MKPELRAALAEKGRCDLPGVLLAAAECAPLAKTGGLADVRQDRARIFAVELSARCRKVWPRSALTHASSRRTTA